MDFFFVYRIVGCHDLFEIIHFVVEEEITSDKFGHLVTTLDSHLEFSGEIGFCIGKFFISDTFAHEFLDLFIDFFQSELKSFFINTSTNHKESIMSTCAMSCSDIVTQTLFSTDILEQS